MRIPFKKALRLTLVSSAVLASGASQAAGFGLMEQSVDSARNVYAGQQAKCNDASYEAANPAMEVCIKKPQLAVGVFAIPVKAKVDSGTWTPGGGGGAPVNISGIKSSIIGVVPNLHFVIPVNSKWSFGMGTYSNAGLQTDYTNSMIPKSTPAGADYQGAPTNTSIVTLDINPSAAYAVSSHFSLGAGLDVVYGSADYDAILAADNEVKNSLSGWGLGFNVGALYRFGNSAIGISYRSKVNIDAKGKMTSLIGNADNSASLPLPQSAALGLSHTMGRFDLLATVKYTNWASLKDLVIVNGKPPAATVDANLNYQDSWFESLGFDYRWNDRLTLGMGLGHDGTVTQDGFRDLRLPGANRITLGVGASWISASGMKLQAAFQHIFSSEVKVDSSKRKDAGSSGYAKATESVNANIIGLGAVIHF